MKFKAIVPASRIWDTQHTTQGCSKPDTEQHWIGALEMQAFYEYDLDVDFIIGDHNAEFKVVFNGFRIEGAIEERIRNIVANTPIVYFYKEA